MQTEAWKEYMKKAQERGGVAFRESVIIDADGTFRAENIPPGDFILSGQIGDPAIKRHSAEWYQNPLGIVKHPFTVPEATEETDYQVPVDIGSVSGEPFERIQVGQDAPVVDLETLDGDPISLGDFYGAYVLLDFGFVINSQNPNEIMDTLKSLYAEFHKSRQLEILSVMPSSKSYGKAMNDSYRRAILYFLFHCINSSFP